MNHKLFVETFAAPLPSSSIPHTSAKNGNVIIGDTSKAFERHKLVTTKHVVKVKFKPEKGASNNDSGMIQMKMKRLRLDHDRAWRKLTKDCTHINELSNDQRGEHISSSSNIRESTPIKEHVKPNLDEEESSQRHDDQQCLAYTSLSFSNGVDQNGYIEAFVMKSSKSCLDETQHSISQSTNTNRISPKVENSAIQSSSDGDRIKEDFFESKNPDSKVTSAHNLYYLVLRGYLTSINNISNSNNVLDNNLSLNQENEESNDKNSNSTNHEVFHNTKHTHDIIAKIAFPYRPSLVKLFESEITNKTREEGFKREMILPVELLIIGEDKTINLYHISQHVNHQSRLDFELIANVDRIVVEGNISLNEKKISVYKSKSNDILNENTLLTMQLMNMLQPKDDAKDDDEYHDLELNSEVTAIDAMQVQSSHNITASYIVVGLKSGVIKIYSHYSGSIQDSNPGNEFTNEYSSSSMNIFSTKCTEFIVDGTANVVDLSIDKENNRLNLIVGSSCGYACLFSKSLDIEAPFRQLPIMIVENLWDHKTNQNDSVNTASKIPAEGGDLIAIGTRSGRVILFSIKHDEGDSGFSVLWFVQLNLPIYAITHCIDRDSKRLSIIIMTQNTVHLYLMDNNADMNPKAQTINHSQKQNKR